jgi:hypothetical protein
VYSGTLWRSPGVSHRTVLAFEDRLLYRRPMRPLFGRLSGPVEQPNDMASGSSIELRRRLLAFSLPVAAILLVVGEAVMPKGLDSQSSSLASTTKQVMIAARHVARFDAASLLIIFGLAAAAVSFAAIAVLVTGRGARFATAAVVLGAVALTCGVVANSTDNLALAEAAAVHPAATVAGRMWVHIDSSPLASTLGVLYFFGWMVAIVLAAIALWRSRAVPRWLAVVFAVANVVSNFSSPGVIPGVPESLPFVAVMGYLALLVWRNATLDHQTAAFSAAPAATPSPPMSA